MGLRKDLSDIIPENLLTYLPDGYEIIGTIAIITIPPELMIYREAIVHALLLRKSSLETILNKIGRIHGKERIPRYQFLYGDKTITEHKEYGFRYRLDISEVFFSSKMASERKRIADLVHPEESVFVPFAGVGPYAIPCACKGAEVIAMELNGSACKWMKQNIALNHVSNHVHILLGDAMLAIHTIHKKFSRIICPSPYGLSVYPEMFEPLFMRNCVIHWILFCNLYEIDRYKKRLQEKNFHILRCQTCGNVAPSVYRWILDLVKKEK